MHHKDAIANTQEVLDQLIQEQNCCNIILKDIRSIKFITDNEFLFTQNIPIYFRIDFLKLLIDEHELVHEHQDAAIFTDLEVGDLRPATDSTIEGTRLNKSELFAPIFMKALQETGILLNKKDSKSQNPYVMSEASGQDIIENFPENQFLQIMNDKIAVETLDHIINIVLMRATAMLNVDKYPEYISYQKASMQSMHNIPFSATINDFAVQYMNQKTNCIKMDEGFFEYGQSNSTFIDFNINDHGYQILGSFSAKNLMKYFATYGPDKPDKMNTNVIKYTIEPTSCKVARETWSRDGSNHTDKYNALEKNHPDFISIPIKITSYSEQDYKVELAGSDV